MEIKLKLDNTGFPYIACECDAFSEDIEDQVMQVFIKRAKKYGIYIDFNAIGNLDSQLLLKVRIPGEQNEDV